MTKSIRHKGPVESTGTVVSYTDAESALMERVSGYARFGGKSAGSVGISFVTVNAGTPLGGRTRVESDGSFFLTKPGTQAVINSEDSSPGQIELRSAAVTNGFLGTTPGYMACISDAAKSVAWGIAVTTGIQNIVGGVNFQFCNLSGSPNVLDEYEEGLFTPTVTFGGGGTGITYVQQTGSYTKIGNRVFFSLDVVLSNKGSSVGNFAIAGLPFTADAASFYKSGSVYSEALVSTSGGIMALVVPSTTTILLFQSTTGSTAAVTNSNASNNSGLIIIGHYTI